MPTVEVTITANTYGGDGLGRLPDGRAVFVPFCLPGERVQIQLEEVKERFARARLQQVLLASPQRISPRCAHYMRCGGCQYQHVPYEIQLEIKREILKDQLARIGKLVDPVVDETVPSTPWNYRNHVQFHLTAEGKLGYHLAGSSDVFAMQECHLPEEDLNSLWPQLDFETIPDLERIGLRTGTGADIQLILESSDITAPDLTIEGLPISVVHLVQDDLLVLAGSQYVEMQVLGRTFQVSAGAFFQVNTAMAEKMVAHILEGLTLNLEMSVLDVYCGVGLFSAFLAERVSKLVGVELSSAACEDFTANLDEFDNVELYEGKAEEILPLLAQQPDVILVDPPRSGLGRPVLDAIVGMNPRQLVYVSCDPATLGRDAKRLIQAGYQLQRITPFDLFPQTYSIESISFWGKS